MTAQALGFDAPPQNPIDAIGQRDHALTLGFVCARVGLHLNRFCADVVELASDGLVKLGGAVACGSSMMPHKRNPDLFELVRAQSALRQGELTSLMQTFQGLGTGYHRDFQQDKQLIFAAVDGTVNCLKMIALGLRHLDLEHDRCLEALRRGDAVATDLTEALVLGGMSFRDAYAAVGASWPLARPRPPPGGPDRRGSRRGRPARVAARLPGSRRERASPRRAVRGGVVRHPGGPGPRRAGRPLLPAGPRPDPTRRRHATSCPVMPRHGVGGPPTRENPGPGGRSCPSDAARVAGAKLSLAPGRPPPQGKSDAPTRFS